MMVLMTFMHNLITFLYKDGHQGFPYQYLPYQGLCLRTISYRVYHYSFTLKGLPCVVVAQHCRGGGGGRGVRDFVVPPTHKKGEIRLCSTKPPSTRKANLAFLTRLALDFEKKGMF